MVSLSSRQLQPFNIKALLSENNASFSNKLHQAINSNFKVRTTV